MRNRRVAFSIVCLVCLLMLSACSGGLSGTQWIVAGSVDEMGNEQDGVGANSAFCALTLAFFEGETGTLRINDLSYTFSYKKKGDTLTVTMQDGQQAIARIDKDRIYWTIGDMTIYFDKKE